MEVIRLIILELRKHKEIAASECLKLNPSINKNHLHFAIEHLSKKGLKYNFSNGTLYLSKEWIKRPIKEIPKWTKWEEYENLEEAVQWELCWEVLNIVLMLERGVEVA